MFGRTFTEPLGIRYDNLFRDVPAPSAKIVRLKKKENELKYDIQRIAKSEGVVV